MKRSKLKEIVIKDIIDSIGFNKKNMNITSVQTIQEINKNIINEITDKNLGKDNNYIKEITDYAV